MSKPTAELFKQIKLNGKTLNHLEQDSKIDAKRDWSSCLLHKQGILVKSEYENPQRTQRNAVITFYDVLSGEIKGCLHRGRPRCASDRVDSEPNEGF